MNNFEAAFDFLTAALRSIGLPTSDRKYRMATPDEFMFTGIEGGRYMFKHVFTRNYLTLSVFNGKPQIVIPYGGPFHGGVFDAEPA